MWWLRKTQRKEEALMRIPPSSLCWNNTRHNENERERKRHNYRLGKSVKRLRWLNLVEEADEQQKHILVVSLCSEIDCLSDILIISEKKSLVAFIIHDARRWRECLFKANTHSCVTRQERSSLPASLLQRASPMYLMCALRNSFSLSHARSEHFN